MLDPRDGEIARLRAALAQADDALKREVEARRRSEEVQRVLDLSARAAIDGIPGFVGILAADGNVEVVNRQILEYCGATLDELQKWSLIGVVHPDDLEMTRDIFFSSVAAGAPYDHEIRLRRFDGTFRWFSNRGVPVKDDAGKLLRWYVLLTDIDDRKRAEERQAASERQLALAIDATPALIWSATPDGRADTVNKHFADYVGKTFEQLAGDGWQVAIHPDDQEALGAVWSDLLAGGEAGQTEARIRRHDGEYRWFLMRANPLRDESGKVIRWYGVNTDIEDRKRAAQAVAANERNLRETIDAIPTLVMCSSGQDGAYEFGNRPWHDYTGLSQEEARDRWPSVLHPDDSKRLMLAWSKMVRTGEGGELEGRLRRFDGTYRWHFLRTEPLRDESGRIVRFYTASLDIEDRKLAEQAVAANERNLRETINAIPTLAWCNRTDGSNEFLNQRWHDYTGLSSEEANGWGWQVALHPDDLPNLLNVWYRMLHTGDSGVLEARLRRHDGVYRWFLFRCDPLRDEAGNIVKWYGTNTDIDDLKTAEQALVESERSLRQTIETIPTIVFSNDAEGANEYISGSWYDYTGLSPEKSAGTGWMRALHVEDRPRMTQALLEMQRTGEGSGTECRVRRRDGVYRWFLFVSASLRDPAGKIIRWYGTVTDIDERKNAEATLRQAYDSFADAQRLSHTGSFVTDLLNDEHRWSDEAYRIFEFEPGSKVTVQRIRDIVHPEDLATFNSVDQNTVRNKKFKITFRITTASGVLKHVEGIGQVIEEMEGRPLFVGALQDVTESKVAENALRRSEAMLAQGEALSETGSFIWNLETREIRWSDQLSRIFGFEIGSPVTIRRIAERTHPLDRALAEDMANKARAGIDSEYEYRLMMPDGSVRYLHFVAKATRDSAGRPEYIGTIQDITERKLAEREHDRVRSELAHAARVMSLGVLTASLAHEVNQPLAGIITNANTGLRMLSADPPNVKGALETARRTIRDGNRASEVVSRLRTLFSKKDFAVETIDLNDATREVLSLSAHELQRHHVTVVTEFASEAVEVAGDRVQIQQVILNLLLNACDAVKGIEGPRMVVVGTADDGTGAGRLTVSDTGIGIGPEQLGKLFDPFYTTKPDGMGIGLSVSRSIIDRHHGRLWATPNDGAGATFAFSIPAKVQ